MSIAARLVVCGVVGLALACSLPEERARDQLGQVRLAYDGATPSSAGLDSLGASLDQLVPEVISAFDDTRRAVAAETKDEARSERARAILKWLVPDAAAADTAERAFFGRLLESAPDIIHAGPESHDASPLVMLRRLSERRSAATAATIHALEEGLARQAEPALPGRVAASADAACACTDRPCLLASRETLRTLTTQTLRYTTPPVRAALDADLQRWRGCVKALSREELERAPLD